jgi:ubiquinone/menaquinone biosynthesis C-methylase UbiE
MDARSSSSHRLSNTMNEAELEALIRPGLLSNSAQTWADFGAGWGNFTMALRRLLGREATIHAVDRDADGLRTIQQRHAQQYADSPLHLWKQDFTQPFDLPPLDGLLMANALHFVPAKRQPEVLALLAGYLKPDGRMILIEYEMRHPRPWVPYPILSDVLLIDLKKTGFKHCTLISNRHSPSGGAGMYSLLAADFSPERSL